jgi:hypothetical protein
MGIPPSATQTSPPLTSIVDSFVVPRVCSNYQSGYRIYHLWQSTCHKGFSFCTFCTTAMHYFVPSVSDTVHVVAKAVAAALNCQTSYQYHQKSAVQHESLCNVALSYALHQRNQQQRTQRIETGGPDPVISHSTYGQLQRVPEQSNLFLAALAKDIPQGLNAVRLTHQISAVR